MKYFLCIFCINLLISLILAKLIEIGSIYYLQSKYGHDKHYKIATCKENLEIEGIKQKLGEEEYNKGFKSYTAHFTKTKGDDAKYSSNALLMREYWFDADDRQKVAVNNDNENKSTDENEMYFTKKFVQEKHEWNAGEMKMNIAAWCQINYIKSLIPKSIEKQSQHKLTNSHQRGTAPICAITGSLQCRINLQDLDKKHECINVFGIDGMYTYCLYIIGIFFIYFLNIF